jgi:hypothetical protein
MDSAPPEKVAHEKTAAKSKNAKAAQRNALILVFLIFSWHVCAKVNLNCKTRCRLNHNHFTHNY